jgi:hypothetical protein
MTESAGVLSGLFDDAEALVKAVLKADREYCPEGVYITLNQPRYKDEQPPSNTLREWACSATSDSDIERYTCLPVDIDTTRPSGTSSTSEELAFAEDMMVDVRSALCEDLGWPEPIVVMSGNGYHLLFGLDMSCDTKATDLVRRSLAALDSMFSTSVCSVDAGNYNPSRIIKLPGTVARKGSNTVERPHRVSRILSMPEELQVVSISQLTYLINLAPTHVEPATSSLSSMEVEVEAFVREHIPHVEVRKAKPFGKGILYELSVCPFNPEHIGTARLIQFPDGRMSFGCFHTSCKDKHWPQLLEHLGLAESDDHCDKGPSVESILLEIAEECEFVLAQYDQSHVTLIQDGKRVTYPVNSRFFRAWLMTRGRESLGRIPKSSVVKEVVNNLDANTLINGRTEDVHIRSALLDGHLYIDLHDDVGRIVDIGPDGWLITRHAPVRFVHHTGMLPLPDPSPKGSIRLLWDVLNISPDSDSAVLLCAWLLKAYVPIWPSPILVLQGREGSAKSFGMKVIRSLVDPSEVPHRSLPTEERNLIIHAHNSAVLAFDNVTSFSRGISNILCRIATGSGYGRRLNYENTEELLFTGIRPIMMNGITVEPEAHDLADRCIIVHLEHIPETQRTYEDTLLEQCASLTPGILGGLYDALSTALRNLDSVEIPRIPRMADFARLIVAAEPSLPWESRQFMKAYRSNRMEIRHDGIFNDPVCIALMRLLHRTPTLPNITATELLKRLREIADDPNELPGSANVFGKQLWEAQTSLSTQGVRIERHRRSSTERSMTITYDPVKED